MNCESEILRKKYKCESNTVNNIELMILEKIRVIRTCSSKPTRSGSSLGTFGTIDEWGGSYVTILKSY